MRAIARLLAAALLPAALSLVSLAATGADEKLEKDTPKTLPTGATFTAPAGWTMKTTGDLVVLESPEGDARIALIDVDAPDAAAAAAAAWAIFKPEMKRPSRSRTDTGIVTRFVSTFTISSSSETGGVAEAVGVWPCGRTRASFAR